MQLSYMASVDGIIRSVDSNDTIHRTIKNIIISTVAAVEQTEKVNCSVTIMAPKKGDSEFGVSVYVTNDNAEVLSKFVSNNVVLKSNTSIVC